MDSRTPLFSILIAEYNNEQYFQKCFDSIIAQTYTNWEVILLDDCSTNKNSLDTIKAIIGENKRFTILINDKNEGVGFTKRKLIELANGEICGFLDPDDALTPDALEVMVETHLENPNIGLAYSNLWICDGELNPIKEKKGKQIEENNPLFFNLHGEIAHFASFKKEIYLKTSGINPYFKIAEDQDLYLKLYEQAPIKYVDKILHYYRIHNNGISTIKNEDKAYLLHWKVIMDACERRNIYDVSDLFYTKFVRIRNMDIYKKEQKLLRRIKDNPITKLINKIRYR